MTTTAKKNIVIVLVALLALVLGMTIGIDSVASATEPSGSAIGAPMRVCELEDGSEMGDNGTCQAGGQAGIAYTVTRVGGDAIYAYGNGTLELVTQDGQSYKYVGNGKWEAIN